MFFVFQTLIVLIISNNQFKKKRRTIMTKEGVIQLDTTSISKTIIQRGNEEDCGQLITGDVCQIGIKLLFEPKCLETGSHDATSLLGISNLSNDQETACFIKIGYFNTQISKILHESIQQMRLGEVACISFELDPTLLDESFRFVGEKSKPTIFLDLKFQINVRQRIKGELFFLNKAIWENQYYYLFGFLFLVFIIVIISCAEISVVMTYFQLCAEDYHWWWRSFISSGGCAFYVFFYSIFYYLSEVRISLDKKTIK